MVRADSDAPARMAGTLVLDGGRPAAFVSGSSEEPAARLPAPAAAPRRRPRTPAHAKSDGELFDEYQRTRDHEVRAMLIERYLDLAHGLAHRFANRGEAMEDLVQVAAMALVKAIDRFDPQHGIPFPAFASPTIVGEIKRYFRDNARVLRVPRRLQELSQELHRIRDDLAQDLGRTPELDEVANQLGVTRDEATWALAAGGLYRLRSLDSVVDGDSADDSETVLDRRLGGDDPEYDRIEARMWVEALTEVLPEHELDLLRMRYFDQMVQVHIADELGMSQMKVSRMLNRTLDRLRRTAEVHLAG